MKWISENTKQNAIFTGSMQLMAGVKCCTNRPIANHPHFEDKWLRDRTQQLYQIYALKSPTEVYKILISENVLKILKNNSNLIFLDKFYNHRRKYMLFTTKWVYNNRIN